MLGILGVMEQDRAGQGIRFGGEAIDLQRLDRTRGLAEIDEMPQLRERVERAVKRILADRVESDIDAAAAGDAPHRLDEVDRAIEDRVVAARLARDPALGVAANRADHGGAE